MIKLKLISLLLSSCLATGIGAGSFASNITNIKSMDLSKVIESLYNPSSEDSSENVEDQAINENNNGTTSNEEVNNEDTTVNESNGTRNEVQTEEANTKQEVSEEDNSGENVNKEISSNSEEKNITTENNTSANSNQAEASDKFIAEIEQAIFEKVNEERVAAGLSALQYNDTMEHYARIKSQDMGDRGYFDHANPEGQYITTQMKADGVSYRAWGENIAYISGQSGNSALATRFMDNWMNSSGHRANILSTNFSSIGVGVYKIGNTYYATQEFYK